jgi:hypothetical protein
VRLKPRAIAAIKAAARDVFGDTAQMRLSSSAEWVRAAQRRERLVHQYPIDGAEQMERVSDTWATSSGLINAYAILRARLADRGLLS